MWWVWGFCAVGGVCGFWDGEVCRPARGFLCGGWGVWALGRARGCGVGARGVGGLCGCGGYAGVRWGGAEVWGFWGGVGFVRWVGGCFFGAVRCGGVGARGWRMFSVGEGRCGGCGGFMRVRGVWVFVGAGGCSGVVRGFYAGAGVLCGGVETCVFVGGGWVLGRLGGK